MMKYDEMQACKKCYENAQIENYFLKFCKNLKYDEMQISKKCYENAQIENYFLKFAKIRI